MDKFGYSVIEMTPELILEMKFKMSDRKYTEFFHREVIAIVTFSKWKPEYFINYDDYYICAINLGYISDYSSISQAALNAYRRNKNEKL